MDASGIKSVRVAKGAMGVMVSMCWDLKLTKVTRVARVPRLKGLLRDRVFSRTHLRSSLTPEEGPSCSFYFLLIFLKNLKIIKLLI